MARSRLVCLVLALVTLLLYLPACFHDFIFFDDPNYVSGNDTVQAGLTWAGMKWAFTTWHASNWHPLTWLSHMLDCQLFGLNAGAQHFVNVLFHAANTVLLFRLILRMTDAFWPGAMIAALFAWHPLHVESVAWIAERKDVLSTLFGLLALLSYARFARNRSRAGKPESKTNRSIRQRDYLLALLFLALGLLAKPMLVTLPFVFLLLDFWPLNRVSGAGCQVSGGKPGSGHVTPGTSHLTRLTREKLPFFLLTAGSCVITFFAQRHEAVVSLEQIPFGARLATATVAYVHYLFQVVWPVDLAILYPLPKQQPGGWVAAAAIFLTVVSAFIWLARRRSPYLLTGWLWFLGTLVPVIGLVQVGSQAMADRYTYLPLIGIFIALVFGARDLAARFHFGRTPVSLAAVLVLGGCLAATEHQLFYWRNTESLFTHTLAVTKDNAVAHMILGVAFERQNRPAEALAQYQEALRLDESLLIVTAAAPKRRLAVQFQLLLGQMAEQQGNLSDALAHYREALRLDPTAVEAHHNLGNLLDETGQPLAALVHYREALRLAPEAALAHINLATLLVKLGQFSEALQEYDRAARLQPDDPQPLYLMGKAYLRQGRAVEAIDRFRAALRLNADEMQTLTWLARVLATDLSPQVRNGTEAVALAERANALAGGTQPFVLDTLAMAYAETGRGNDAQQTLQKAIDLATAAKQTEMVSAMRQRLRLYQSGRPYRETFTNAPPKPPL